MKKVPLSGRIRPNSEAAPWVVEEVKQLEAESAKMRDIILLLDRELQKWIPPILKPGTELKIAFDALVTDLRGNL